MPGQGGEVVVGLDNGGTAINATVLDSAGRFLVDRLVETPSRVAEGPAVAIEALSDAFTGVLGVTGVSRAAVRAVGLDTPGPASADGVISTRGAVNFANPAWRGFDVRGALAARLGLPVIYNNDANAASLYAHHVHFGPDAGHRSSVSLIVGTGLGGGVIESGRVVRGAAGMAGEFGHIQIPMDGLLAPGQPVPVCNCGLPGDGESIASLTGIQKDLLPYWLAASPATNSTEPVPCARRRTWCGGRLARVTRWRWRSSASRRSRSAGCSPSLRTSPIRTPISWVGAWSRRRRTSATGSWPPSSSTPTCATSSARW